jgi:hypothetical protein
MILNSCAVIFSEIILGIISESSKLNQNPSTFPEIPWTGFHFNRTTVHSKAQVNNIIKKKSPARRAGDFIGDLQERPHVIRS